MAAYLGFKVAEYQSDREPGPQNLKALEQFVIDPALATVTDFLTSLQIGGLGYRGNPPQARVRTVSINLRSKPYPTVRLMDCPTVSLEWRPYVLSTMKPAALVPNKVRPPYASTVEVVKLDGGWRVRTTTTDNTKTCTP